ncbi:MAG: DNA translocase FtsK [Anaerolineae bacterium]|nr:DNA translocase FtsK [Anaerolineae bacterium]
MPQSNRGRMARPRGASSQRGSHSSSGSSRDETSQTSFLNSLLPVLLKLARRGIRFLSGPTGQQFLSLGIMGFGLLTLLTISQLNDSGALMNAWSRFLVFLFGWGAYPTAVFIVALGLLWLRHIVHRPTAWRWRPFIGLELTLMGLLTLTHTLSRQQSWGLVESGLGGGLVGWSLYVFLSDTLGGPLVIVFLMILVILLGLGLAFDLRGGDLVGFSRRLGETWSAWRARRAMAKSTASSESLGDSIAVPDTIAVPVDAPPISEPHIERVLPTLPRQLHSEAKAETRERKQKPISRPEHLPPLSLLREIPLHGMGDAEIQEKARIIEVTLAQFGLPAAVTDVRPGPTVTQFGVEPGYISRGPEDEAQRKVRVSQIASLADDLALALAAKSLRVEAPVPGRAVVGLEVPNAEISMVSLRSVLESEAFAKCGKPLCFAVGLDVAGTPVVADLAAMPHLLVAGTTGSGKSVFIKTLAASLVMFNTPETLRLITIDPKIVELSHLNGLPHLMGRTETDLEQILRTLRWIAHEMDERYKKFSAAVARNLDDYNRKMARQNEEALPRIVVLIDELADLMMSAPDETEHTVTRLAQMARATGIHLVVATQRPSTDVVTGLIKANFPARLSFATASTTDSRVIIDTPGAESLLGRGDMLFLPPDAAVPVRVQGCYLSDEELEAIIKSWQTLAGATPSKAPWQVLVEASGPESWRVEGQPEDADLLERAIALAKKQGKISTSGVQRRLRISYNRAARLMEEMEKMGLVSPQESAGRKRRVILGGDDEE